MGGDAKTQENGSLDPKTRAKWTNIEVQRYIKFIKHNLAQLASKKSRIKSRVFVQMAKKVKTRTKLQCKSRHQKMLLKMKSLHGIIRQFEYKQSDFPQSNFVVQQDSSKPDSSVSNRQQQRTGNSLTLHLQTEQGNIEAEASVFFTCSADIESDQDSKLCAGAGFFESFINFDFDVIQTINSRNWNNQLGNELLHFSADVQAQGQWSIY